MYDMDKKTIVEKFHRDRVGLRFYENPIRLHVWEYRPFAEPIPDPEVWEYALHYGDHGETSTEKFATEEEACVAAWTQAIVYLEDTLEEFKE
jgi:hypothetical protein